MTRDVLLYMLLLVAFVGVQVALAVWFVARHLPALPQVGQ